MACWLFLQIESGGSFFGIGEQSKSRVEWSGAESSRVDLSRVE